MQSSVRRIRKPVKRDSAEQYLMITLVSFAAAVILTRLLLQLSGYPQVGNANLHIAHVLWGGLLLFIASLLPLLFANRWVYPTGALLAGVGIGLFIDEVGSSSPGTTITSSRPQHRSSTPFFFLPCCSTFECVVLDLAALVSSFTMP